MAAQSKTARGTTKSSAATKSKTSEPNSVSKQNTGRGDSSDSDDNDSHASELSNTSRNTSPGPETHDDDDMDVDEPHDSDAADGEVTDKDAESITAQHATAAESVPETPRPADDSAAVSEDTLMQICECSTTGPPFVDHVKR
jgi:hypothetical protein